MLPGKYLLKKTLLLSDLLSLFFHQQKEEEVENPFGSRERANHLN